MKTIFRGCLRIEKLKVLFFHKVGFANSTLWKKHCLCWCFSVATPTNKTHKTDS